MVEVLMFTRSAIADPQQHIYVLLIVASLFLACYAAIIDKAGKSQLISKLVAVKLENRHSFKVVESVRCRHPTHNSLLSLLRYKSFAKFKISIRFSSSKYRIIYILNISSVYI